MLRQMLRQRIAAHLKREHELEISPIITRATAGFGEWTSNAPLQAAKQLNQAPEQIGHTLKAEIMAHFPGRVELQAGRLNFFMSDDFFRSTLEQATRDGAHFGAGEVLASQRILVEYVSADPTGPLSFVAGRHAALGESLCRLLEWQGARVTREFYLNDATSSSKIRLLGEGVAHWYLEAFGRAPKRESEGISDVFVRGIAAELARRDGAKWLDSSPEERIGAGSRAALESAVAAQKATLERFGVRFDEWVSETDLRNEGRVEALFERFAERGLSYSSDGALWLKTSAFGDEADRVLQRRDGKPTYFAGDMAHHLWKAERGYNRIINIWSVEHKPYITRTKAALQAAGCDLESFEFLVAEGAVLKRDGATLRLGSGGGPLLLEEELEEIGSDALKFYFVGTPAAKTAEIDLEIARRDDETSAAYAAQLLPSRLARLEREAQGKMAASDAARTADETAEWSPGEREVARLVALWSDETAEAALCRDPSRVTRWVGEMSAATRVLLEKTAPHSNVPLPQRLQLLRAALHATTGALKLLGMEAHEKF
ncbi:MAG TPA: arginine--tRNA ligase [Abditibacterium sp.]